MSRSDDIEELSEYLAIDMDMSYDELQHFDLPKFKMPKIDLPKFDLPKFELPKIDLPFGKKDKKKNKSKEKDKKDKKKDKKKEGAGTKDKSSGRYGREWKDHKWVDRKRDENGKWIYDYGDGFPDEQNAGKGVGIPLKDTPAFDPAISEESTKPRKVELEQNNKLAKFTGLINDLGRMLISPALNDKIAAGKNFLGRIDEIKRTAIAEVKKFGKEVDPDTGLRKKDPNNKDSAMDDLDSVNPGWENNDMGSQMNCPECTVAMDLRRRGYEVTAKEDINGENYGTLESLYKGGELNIVYNDDPTVQESVTDTFYEAMKNEPEGSSGMMVMQWNGGGGHVVHYEIENGEPIIYDAQCRKRFEAWEYTDKSWQTGYMRTDNLEPNWDVVKEMVE